VLDAQSLAGLVEQRGAIRCAVIGQDAFDPDALGGEASDCCLEEGAGRVLALIGVDLHEAGTRMVVDGHMGELPARTLDRVAPIAGDAVTRANNATELLGVQVQHLAGRSVFVAHKSSNRLERLQARQAQPSQPAADRRDATADELGDAPHGHTQPPQLLDRTQQRLVNAASGVARARAAIGQAAQTLLLEASEPLPCRAQADAGGLGRRPQPHHSDPLDQQLATFKGQSGILVTVHPVVLSASAEAS
jgi:hypothetical protein